MIRQRQRHRGFSLTEVLMAAGILGVGMTMVASVFPVAVDQSRQSGDTTMAALSARSIAAVLRARRTSIMKDLRQVQGDVDPRDTTWLLDETTLPDRLRCYNPHRFLYPPSNTAMGTPADRVRSYQVVDDDLWSAGAYTPVVFATPMNTLMATGNEESEGPWRITIAIYKARGRSPALQVGASTTHDIPLVSWGDPQRWGQGEPGDFFMDFNPANTSRHNYRGEAYKVSRIHPGRNPDNPSDDSVFPVVALRTPEDSTSSKAFVADRDVDIGQRGDVNQWLSLRGAIAVYHTILGD